MRRTFFFALLCGVIAFFSSCEPITYDTFATLSVTVVDATDGEPVDDARVSLMPGGRSHETGLNGNYEFNNLEAGTYTIQVMANGYHTNTRGVTLVPGETFMVTIPLKKQE